jgi:hypothetical protein
MQAKGKSLANDVIKPCTAEYSVGMPNNFQKIYSIIFLVSVTLLNTDVCSKFFYLHAKTYLKNNCIATTINS